MTYTAQIPPTSQELKHPLQWMIDAGVPVEHTKAQANKHLQALKSMDQTDSTIQHIKHTEDFIESLK